MGNLEMVATLLGLELKVTQDEARKAEVEGKLGIALLDLGKRDQALARMRTALNETVIEGIQTNIPLHRELMVDAKFMSGGTNIHYLEEWLAAHKR